MGVSLVEYEAARGKNAHPTNTVKNCKYNERINTFPGRKFETKLSLVANVNKNVDNLLGIKKAIKIHANILNSNIADFHRKFSALVKRKYLS